MILKNMNRLEKMEREGGREREREREKEREREREREREIEELINKTYFVFLNPYRK